MKRPWVHMSSPSRSSMISFPCSDLTEKAEELKKRNKPTRTKNTTENESPDTDIWKPSHKWLGYHVISCCQV